MWKSFPEEKASFLLVLYKKLLVHVEHFYLLSLLCSCSSVKVVLLYYVFLFF